MKAVTQAEDRLRQAATNRRAGQKIHRRVTNEKEIQVGNGGNAEPPHRSPIAAAVKNTRHLHQPVTDLEVLEDVRAVAVDITDAETAPDPVLIHQRGSDPIVDARNQNGGQRKEPEVERFNQPSYKQAKLSWPAHKSSMIGKTNGSRF